MPPKKVGRPKSVRSRIEAEQKANQLIQDFINGTSTLSQAGLRSAVTRLGRGSSGEKWFTYTQKKTENGGKPFIKEYKSSSPNISNVKSIVKNQMNQMGDSLKDQLDLQKIANQKQKTKTETKQETKQETKEFEFDWGSVTLDPSTPPSSPKNQSKTQETKTQSKPVKPQSRPVKPPALPPRPFSQQRPQVPDYPLRFIGKKQPQAPKRPPPKRPIPSGPESYGNIERKITSSGRMPENKYYDPNISRLIEPINPYNENNYIHELMDGGLEYLPELESLNQNIQGINEMTGRNIVDDEDDDFMTRAWKFVAETEMAQKYGRYESEDELDFKHGEYQPEDKYEKEVFKEPTKSELAQAEDYLDRKAGNIIVIPRQNAIPEFKDQMKNMVLDKIKQAASSVGMNIPLELKNMGIDTLEQLSNDSGISIDKDDITSILSGFSGTDLSSLISGENLPFGNLIQNTIQQYGGGLVSAGIKRYGGGKYGGVISGVLKLGEKLPESLKDKIKEAGGTALDALRFPQKEIKETKETKETKDDKPKKPFSLFGFDDDFDVGAIGPSGGAVGAGGGPGGPGGGGGGPKGAVGGPGGGGGGWLGGGGGGGGPGGGGGAPSVVSADPREAIMEQINRINMSLEDKSRGSKGNSYPEQRDIKSYRFPRADENYNAVQLVQNATTGYLNDLNMYGNGETDEI